MKLICYRTSRSSISIASAYLYTTLSSKNHAIYDPKLRHLHSKTPIVTTPKPHACECRTGSLKQPYSYALFFFYGGDIKLSVMVVLRSNQIRLKNDSIPSTPPHPGMSTLTVYRRETETRV